jgi:hypothetical protein
MPIVGVGMQEADGNDLRAARRHPFGNRAGVVHLERPLHPSHGDPFGHGKGELGGGQRWRVVRRQIVQGSPVLAAQGQQVGRTLGGAERYPGASALEEKVGHDRRSVDDAVDGARRCAERRQRVVDAATLIVRCAGDLSDHDLAVPIHGHQIGEGPADVDAD